MLPMSVSSTNPVHPSLNPLPVKKDKLLVHQAVNQLPLTHPPLKKPKKPVRGSTTSTGRSGKASKGLRHFSAKVCEKVKQKGTTTYNQVADELVREFAARVLNNAVDQTYDEKNIRRRVYDALNVLMAMDIITKEKKKHLLAWFACQCGS